MIAHIKKLPSIFRIFVFVGICLLVFVGFFIYSFFTHKAPIFFPLDNMQGTYQVIKSPIRGNNPPTVSFSSSDPYYLIRYTGDRIFPLHSGDTFSILIGESPVDLAPFVGKYVVVQGEFVGSSRQCVREQCISIKGPWVVLNIKEIQIKN